MSETVEKKCPECGGSGWIPDWGSAVRHALVALAICLAGIVLFVGGVLAVRYVGKLAALIAAPGLLLFVFGGAGFADAWNARRRRCACSDDSVAYLAWGAWAFVRWLSRR